MVDPNSSIIKSETPKHTALHSVCIWHAIDCSFLKVGKLDACKIIIIYTVLQEI